MFHHQTLIDYRSNFSAEPRLELCHIHALPPFSCPTRARTAVVIHSLKAPVMSDSHEVHSPRTGYGRSHRQAALDVLVGAALVPSDVMLRPAPSGAASDTQDVHASGH